VLKDANTVKFRPHRSKLRRCPPFSRSAESLAASAVRAKRDNVLGAQVAALASQDAVSFVDNGESALIVDRAATGAALEGDQTGGPRRAARLAIKWTDFGLHGYLQ